jgi:VIT1/CCC1 family predicted Fe2+/Mn2+ transporter
MDKKRIEKTIKKFQENEITEHFIYKALSKKMKGKNSKILNRIANEEFRHYKEWKEYTKAKVQPKRSTVLKYSIISKIFGLTFAIKMMENGEEKAQKIYAAISEKFPKAKKIFKDETEHEKLLINMIDEEKIGYMSSMVLGLNDALVELTGTLAGLTFALQNTKLIGIAGLITGIAASLSMASSEYLSQKSEKEGKNPMKASFYTGLTYILTVLFLVIPYFLLTNFYSALTFTVLNAFFAILFFTFFVSVVKELSFKKTLLEMVIISFGVAAVSFFIGLIVRIFLKIEI